MNELKGPKGSITLPFAGQADLFDFQKGGKQGGVEIPESQLFRLGKASEWVLFSKPVALLHDYFIMQCGPTTSFCLQGVLRMMQTMIEDVNVALATSRNCAQLRHMS